PVLDDQRHCTRQREQCTEVAHRLDHRQPACSDAGVPQWTATGTVPFRSQHRLRLVSAEDLGCDSTLQHFGKVPRRRHAGHYPRVSTTRPTSNTPLTAATASTARRVQPLSSTRRAGPDSAKPASRNGASIAVLVIDGPVTCPAAASATSEITEPST